mgnify:CR=1 FL=1
MLPKAPQITVDGLDSILAEVEPVFRDGKFSGLSIQEALTAKQFAEELEIRQLDYVPLVTFLNKVSLTTVNLNKILLYIASFLSDSSDYLMALMSYFEGFNYRKTSSILMGSVLLYDPRRDFFDIILGCSNNSKKINLKSEKQIAVLTEKIFLSDYGDHPTPDTENEAHDYLNSIDYTTPNVGKLILRWFHKPELGNFAISLLSCAIHSDYAQTVLPSIYNEAVILVMKNIDSVPTRYKEKIEKWLPQNVT